MKQINTYIIIVFLTLLISCCSESSETSTIISSDENWVEEIIDGASVTIKPFLPGDDVTRSSLVFGNQSLVFGWQQGDQVGIYPTAMNYNMASDDEKNNLLDKDQYRHPAYTEDVPLYRINPSMSEQQLFKANYQSTSQTIKVENTNESFDWDEKDYWTAYFPYSNVNPENENYTYRTFDFSEQVQNGLVNVSAYKNGTSANPTTGSSNPEYLYSENNACAHLGTKDVMISPEKSWSGSRINFPMRHVGAIIRFYLLAPKVNLIIDNIKLICDSKIFYEKGAFTLISHPYKANAQDGNYGVNLNLSDKVGCQINPIGEPTNMIQLSFSKTTAAQTVYDERDSYKRYVTAYIMTYPITYDPKIHGNLFAYVTAHKVGETAEYHFVSKPLEGKTMESGHYYQFTSSTHADDGLYPIELTATLLPWQDIVGGGIETDLEK